MAGVGGVNVEHAQRSEHDGVGIDERRLIMSGQGMASRSPVRGLGPQLEEAYSCLCFRRGWSRRCWCWRSIPGKVSNGVWLSDGSSAARLGPDWGPIGARTSNTECFQDLRLGRGRLDQNGVMGPLHTIVAASQAAAARVGDVELPTGARPTRSGAGDDHF